jgi:ubiquinone/menaquinone biosynthesis C-methylase UbiE
MSHDEGWRGWDEYAPFYDWENARTLGRKDVAFWTRVASGVEGRVLELGCGTGRISLPLARAGARIVGVDRSALMLERAARRARRLNVPSRAGARRRITLVRSDIRALPFADEAFAAVLAPYGVLQSLIRDRDLSSTLASVARVIKPGGLFGVDLVPDVPKWREYSNRVQMRGRAPGGARLTLVESVRQERRRRRTVFRQLYRVRRGMSVTEHRFDLTFRTLPIRLMIRRLERAGFAIDCALGDYQCGPWDDRADVWILLARRRL